MKTRVALMMVTLTLVIAHAALADAKRYPIPAEAIGFVKGVCYVASMDFGEDGYKEAQKNSGLKLYEDGKELGPIDNLHANIIEKGEGLYSHWTRESLFFSTSDNSDPRTNGRTYEVASTNPASELGR